MFLRTRFASIFASIAVALVALTALATAAEEGAGKQPRATVSNEPAPSGGGAEINQNDRGLIVPPSAPRPAQIEPMVAPVKRSAPQTPSRDAKKTTASFGKEKPDSSKSKPAGKSAADQKAAQPKTSSKSDDCSTGQKVKGERCVKLKLADQETAAKKAKKK